MDNSRGTPAGSGRLESAILLPVPETEPVIGALRLQYDPGARVGLPAHVTLLYPFAPPGGALMELDTLANMFRDIRRFPFSLVGVRRFPATVYLYPDPAEHFVRMTSAIVARWPQYQPYGGRFPEVIPHVTVADRATVEILDAVDDSVRAQLPIRCYGAEVWLMCSNENGVWTKAASFELGS